MKNRYLGYIKAFGRNVRKLRNERGLTQQQLGFIADVEQNQIYRLENGLHGATLQTIVAVAVALGKQPRELHEFYFKLPLNKNFDFPTARRGQNETTLLVKTLVMEKNFFDTYRQTADVIRYYKKKNRVLKSSDVSGVLRNLYLEKVLERVPGEKKGTFRYRRAKRQAL